MPYNQRFNEWKEKVTDSDLKLKLKEMENDETLKKNSFYKELEFGTGGLRGEIGVGSNCLNIYTIAKVTQGIADRMKAKGESIAAISYDSRINSELFAHTAASVFALNNIKAYITKELMPTPFLSFITRAYKADIGVMITASHNPAKYNGYKVYGADGCQLTDSLAAEMTSYIDKIDPFEVKFGAFEDYLKSKMIEFSSDALIEEFLSEVYSRRIQNEPASALKLIYSPLNGAGYKLVPEILKRIGITDISFVKEQNQPDGNFPTCPYPNPEKKEALKLGIEEMEKSGADLLIATDPDCDRMGIAVCHKGKTVLLSGNEVGALLTDYLFSQRKINKTLPEKPVLVKTIVSTDLGVKIAKKYGAEVFDVLTGFKYIGEIIGKLEAKGEADRFVLGFEESYGYLAGSYVRDKDAVVASMLTAEMAAFHKRNGKTLVDRINELYGEFGTYVHTLKSFEYPGADGSAEMQRLLKNLRSNPPKEIGDKKVVKTIDYLTQKEFDLPPSNVMSFYLEDSSTVIVRPSGTEPLIKMYISVSKTPLENEKAIKSINGYLEREFGK